MQNSWGTKIDAREQDQSYLPEGEWTSEEGTPRLFLRGIMQGARQKVEMPSAPIELVSTPGARGNWGATGLIADVLCKKKPLTYFLLWGGKNPGGYQRRALS